MSDIRCPECGAPLGLRLLPDFDSDAWCLACDKPIPSEFLLRSGLPAELLERLKVWGRKSPKITGVGIEGEVGPDLDDANFVVAWKEVRAETLALLSDFRRHLPAKADVVADVFVTRRPDQWSDAEILSWRRTQLRFQDIFRYGWLLAQQFRGEGGTASANPASLPIPYPETVDSDEERKRFRSGFDLGFNIGQPQHSASELAELERRLAIRS